MLFSCAIFSLRCGDKLLASAQKPWIALPPPRQGATARLALGTGGPAFFPGTGRVRTAVRAVGLQSKAGWEAKSYTETGLPATFKGPGLLKWEDSW